MKTIQPLSVTEISKHASPTDAWIVVSGKVYDVTEFALQHPGGAGTILQFAGRDATRAYNDAHTPSVITETLPRDKCLGEIDPATVTPEWSQSALSEPGPAPSKPPLSAVLSTHDFERIAHATISQKAWAFYTSADTDLITKAANKSFYERIWFRPRVLKDVSPEVGTSTTILGCPSRTPFFVSPASMAKLIHPEGEKALARGAAASGIIQCISSSATFPVSEIVPAAPPNQPFFFQLYVHRERTKSEALLAQVQALGIKAIFLTVDAPVAGKREADERVPAPSAAIVAPMNDGAVSANDAKGGGLGRIMGSYIDASLDWADLAWLRAHTSLPIVLKGVQTAADARLAMEAGVAGIVLSNHGGRNLDTSPPSILVLLELHRLVPEIFESGMEIFVDGGIRRGTDVLKALCLGARAVGVGRPFLYALNYGAEGVEHLVTILDDELKTAMRLVGITDLSQVHPGLVNTLDLDHLVPTTEGHPYAKWRPKARI